MSEQQPVQNPEHEQNKFNIQVVLLGSNSTSILADSGQFVKTTASDRRDQKSNAADPQRKIVGIMTSCLRGQSGMDWDIVMHLGVLPNHATLAGALTKNGFSEDEVLKLISESKGTEVQLCQDLPPVSITCLSNRLFTLHFEDHYAYITYRTDNDITNDSLIKYEAELESLAKAVNTALQDVYSNYPDPNNLPVREQYDILPA
jgi:hypothetical protein